MPPRSKPPIAPMEALLVEQLPAEDGWQFEPKWDGFRCIAVRHGATVELWSKSGKPLGRYFPEIEALVAGLKTKDVQLDGELLVEIAGAMSFDALQARLHPAESRVKRLSKETPAVFVAFDCLRLGGKKLVGEPLEQRRAVLETLVASENQPSLLLSPRTFDAAQAGAWFSSSGPALDGVIAKRRSDSYRPGERAMLKVKARRTADCVVGGYRRERDGTGVASLLLGLYDDEGLLNHVGFTSSIAASDRPYWAAELRKLEGGPGFTGNAPGGPSRWATDRSTDWQPLKPSLVVEVLFDQVTGERFRHGTRLLRRRPDKAPSQCTMDQMRRPLTKAEVERLVGG